MGRRGDDRSHHCTLSTCPTKFSVGPECVPPPPQSTPRWGLKASVSTIDGSNVEFLGEGAYIAKATKPLPHSHRAKPKHRIPTPTPRTNPSSPPGINWTHRSIKHFRRGQRVCLQKYFQIVLGCGESELTGWGEVNKQAMRDFFSGCEGNHLKCSIFSNGTDQGRLGNQQQQKGRLSPGC